MRHFYLFNVTGTQYGKHIAHKVFAETHRDAISKIKHQHGHIANAAAYRLHSLINEHQVTNNTIYVKIKQQ